MTTGQTNKTRRTRMRLRNKNHPLNRGQENARMLPGVADLMRHIMIVTGSLGADAPPINR